jgi:DNA-binding transcriptional ArsR family regulator
VSDPRTEVFAALADPTRWRLLEELAGRGRGTATTLASQMPVSRPAVIKHLAVLGRAGLVERQRVGREVIFAIRTEPLQETANWMARLASDWDTRLAALKRLAEEQVQENAA